MRVLSVVRLVAFLVLLTAAITVGACYGFDNEGTSVFAAGVTLGVLLSLVIYYGTERDD